LREWLEFNHRHPHDCGPLPVFGGITIIGLSGICSCTNTATVVMGDGVTVGVLVTVAVGVSVLIVPVEVGVGVDDGIAAVGDEGGYVTDGDDVAAVGVVVGGGVVLVGHGVLVGECLYPCAETGVSVVEPTADTAITSAATATAITARWISFIQSPCAVGGS
jgi:hypothetical protein